MMSAGIRNSVIIIQKSPQFDFIHANLPVGSTLLASILHHTEKRRNNQKYHPSRLLTWSSCGALAATR
jgi:hypothetical protein